MRVLRRSHGIMTDVSILEYAVLAIIGYSGIIILAVSVLKDVPNTKNLSIARIVFIMPSMICNAALMGVGLRITMPTMSTNSTTFGYNVTTGVIIDKFSENVTSGGANIILGPTWNLIHLMLFLILMLYLAFQILNLFYKTE